LVAGGLIAAPFAGVSTHPIPASRPHPAAMAAMSSSVVVLALVWVALVGVAISAVGAVLLARDRRRARAPRQPSS
jgi:hypothetical protein